MPSVMAIVSKALFEQRHQGRHADLGDIVDIDSYQSVNPRLDGLRTGGDLYLVTVRPGEVLWLIAVLVAPTSADAVWTAAPNKTEITDISTLRDKIRFAKGKGISTKPGALAMSLQSPRELSDDDVALLKQAIQTAPQPTQANQLDEVNEQHVIEPAKSGRSKCQTCRKSIAKGSLRLAESVMSEFSRDVVARYHHLECAAKSQPYKLQPALRSAIIEIPGEEALHKRIEETLSVTDVAQQDAETKDEYDKFVQLVMTDANSDEAVMVFADWLQSVEDPRGELIVVQGEKQNATGDRWMALDDRERALFAAHRRQFVPDSLEGAIEWHQGFVRRIELTERTSLVREALTRIFSHPSLMLIEELSIRLRPGEDIIIAPNVPTLPPSLTKLELHQSADARLGKVSELIAPAPRLDALVIRGVADIEALAHPTLTKLDITVGDATQKHKHLPSSAAMQFTERLFELPHKKMPALSHLCISVDAHLDEVCVTLAKTDLLAQLSHVKLCGGMTIIGAQALADHAGTLAKLPALDVSENNQLDEAALAILRDAYPQITEHIAILAAVEKTATLPDDTGEWMVRHSRRPEWGIGRVVHEHDDSLEVEFENAGHKLIRSPELLEDA